MKKLDPEPGVIRVMSWGVTPQGQFVIRALLSDGTELTRVDVPAARTGWLDGEWSEGSTRSLLSSEVWAAKEGARMRGVMMMGAARPVEVARAILHSRALVEDWCRAARRRAERRFHRTTDRTRADIEALVRYFEEANEHDLADGSP